MPNGNRTYYLNRSQPPFLSEMVRDIYTCYNDKKWLKNAYEILEIEYKFWMSKRISDIGLNHYDSEMSDLTDNYINEIYTAFINRVNFKPSTPVPNIVRHTMATCESGWDMTPRWDFEAYNFAPIDLNSILYGFEKNMEYISDELGLCDNVRIWKLRAESRLSQINAHMLNSDGIFMDYNYKTGAFGQVFSVASYYTMYERVATAQQAEALVKKLNMIETEYGILTCEKIDTDIEYQWGYPNGWACLQYIMIQGLDNYGYKQEAKRIAEKYVNLTEKVFKDTDNLWKKYNVAKGNINAVNEYKMPTMLGWSAGVYVFAKNYLKINL